MISIPASIVTLTCYFPHVALGGEGNYLRGNVSTLDLTSASVDTISLQADACQSTLGWNNGFSGCWWHEGRREADGCTPLGWTCEGYRLQGWCYNGQQIPQSVSGVYAFGPTLNYPEKNCCVCGGGHATPPEGYTTSTVNCYNGQGADEIDDDATAPKNLDVNSCAHRCNSDDQCDCFTISVSTGQCFKRANCTASSCEDSDGEWNTYFKRKTSVPVAYKEYSANCYAGHGADDIDTDDTAPMAYDEAACAARCDANARCTCFVIALSTGQCFMREHCDPWHCDAGDGEYRAFIK